MFVFRVVLSIDVSAENIYLYYMSVKYMLSVYFWCFFVTILPTGWYAKQTKSKQFVNPSSVLYMRAQVNSSTIANICWLIQAFKQQCFGTQALLNRFGCIIWKSKAMFDKEYSHYIIFALHYWLCNKCGLYIFPIVAGSEFGVYWVVIVPNLRYIHTSLEMLWPFQWMLIPRYSTGWVYRRTHVSTLSTESNYEMQEYVNTKNASRRRMRGNRILTIHSIPDSKVHGANMGPNWVLSDPVGPHVGPMKLAISDSALHPVALEALILRYKCTRENMAMGIDQVNKLHHANWWMRRITQRRLSKYLCHLSKHSSRM